MGIFNKLDRAIFLNKNTIVEKYISKLEELEKDAIGSLKEEIKREIACCKYGEHGEKQILFELKNANIPMVVIRNFIIQDGENIAQIDFLIITKKLVYVVESKNFVGNITLDNRGRFTREYFKDGVKVKESIYSPITQNQRHMEILKHKRAKNKNFISKIIFEKNFNNLYRDLVVLTNPKSIINDIYAPKEIKGKVIRADELVEYIRRENLYSNEPECSDKELINLTESFVKMRDRTVSTYSVKYNRFLNRLKEQKINSIEENLRYKVQLKKELKYFRYNKAIQEKIKPYFIFTNKELEEILEKLPKTKEELMEIKGFSLTKIFKYGDDILNIINKT